MTTPNPQRLIATAGLLTLLAATAPFTLGVLWWALMPAAGLLAAGLLADPRSPNAGAHGRGGWPSPACWSWLSS